MVIRLYITFFIILLILAFLFPLSSKEKTAEITFREGETISKFSRKLREHGIIRFEKPFNLLFKIFGVEKNIRSGIYKLVYNEGEILTFIRIVSQKPKPFKIKITIYEGMNSFEIAKMLSQKLKINYEKFISLVNDSAFIEYLSRKHNRLKNLKSLEGFLFPDTYIFSESEEEKFIIEKLVDNFFDKIEKIDSLFNITNLSFYDVIKLASIIEKEAYYEEEKPTIASVFLNRLRINMPLQANPTIAYVLKTNSYWLSEEEIKFNSPYNTYINLGLPPTPICSPSLSSIIAVLKPKKTDYLYFVANKDKKHLFAKTYSEHLKNIKKVR
ncbi:MAG: endolytic transglycosylase MltG [candidate division WOR-3 bacterium]|nr:endolytic transglycosylase MltG [candidate division WOR-3 bacterium]MCX7947903.1 endolytic transglycosylase MltG [candidate division WOR-3 bacterium]MDW8150725.1 endolytic transglycosylase MltG [candidate division WOR-3 bacterium]